MYIDMHCHSVSSDDSRATVEGYLKWIQVLRKRGHTVDAIVLTEHRKFDQDADYSTLGSQYGVLVMKGSELDTACGHFLVYGVNEQLRKSMDFANVHMDSLELMQAATASGAVAIPAHPGRSGIGLCEYIQQGRSFEGLRIVETHNGGSRRGENERSGSRWRDSGRVWYGLREARASDIPANVSCRLGHDTRQPAPPRLFPAVRPPSVDAT